MIPAYRLMVGGWSSSCEPPAPRFCASPFFLQRRIYLEVEAVCSVNLSVTHFGESHCALCYCGAARVPTSESWCHVHDAPCLPSTTDLLLIKNPWCQLPKALKAFSGKNPVLEMLTDSLKQCSASLLGTSTTVRYMMREQTTLFTASAMDPTS